MTWKISNTPTDPDPYYGAVSLLLHGDGENGSTNIIDSSLVPKTVTAVGNAQISTAQSKFGGASIAFDGTGDYLRIPSSTDFEFGTGDFTIEFWWNRSSVTLGGLVDLGFNHGGIGIYQDSSFLAVREQSLNRIIVAPFSANTWVHVALARSSGSLRLFFNGVQQGSTVASSANLTNTFGVCAFGAYVYNGGYYATPFAYLDDLRITKGVARYTANFIPPSRPFYDFIRPEQDPYFYATSLLLHGDGANGSTTIVDSSPSPKTVTAAGNAQISTAQSKFGGASMYFDGTGDYLTAGTSTDYSFGTGDFTIEAWVYTTTSGTIRAIIDTRSGDALGNYYVGINTSNQFYFIVNGATIAGTLTVSVNTWTHVAVTRSSGSVRLFVNGSLSTTFAAAGVIDQSAFMSIGAGRSFSGSTISGYYFNGYIDDLRITKGIARYTSNFTPPTRAFPDF